MSHLNTLCTFLDFVHPQIISWLCMPVNVGKTVLACCPQAPTPPTPTSPARREAEEVGCWKNVHREDPTFISQWKWKYHGQTESLILNTSIEWKTDLFTLFSCNWNLNLLSCLSTQPEGYRLFIAIKSMKGSLVLLGCSSLWIMSVCCFFSLWVFLLRDVVCINCVIMLYHPVSLHVILHISHNIKKNYEPISSVKTWQTNEKKLSLSLNRNWSDFSWN